jgi:hypothetical protein
MIEKATLGEISPNSYHSFIERTAVAVILWDPIQEVLGSKLRQNIGYLS